MGANSLQMQLFKYLEASSGCLSGTNIFFYSISVLLNNYCHLKWLLIIVYIQFITLGMLKRYWISEGC